METNLANSYEVAVFAGGCFWCMQPPFDPQNVKGVIETRVGYTGGHQKNPTYEEVCSGVTGHAEAVEVTFDPRIVTYEKLLEIFWQNIDPTVKNRQFADNGTQYRTAIFYHTDTQKKAAETSKRQIELSGRFDKPIVTEISRAGLFYPAEEYHQKYYQKAPLRYHGYKDASGRSDYLKRKWGKTQ